MARRGHHYKRPKKEPAELNITTFLNLMVVLVPFLLIKNGLTIVGVLFLCLHKNFRLVKPLITGVLILYVLLLFYHLYLTTV